MKGGLRTLWASCQELVFPSSCLACGRRLSWRDLPLFCAACRPAVRAIEPPLCRCCGTPFVAGHDQLCGSCLRPAFAFDLAHSALVYQPPVTSLISALKFEGQLAGLTSLAALARTSSG